MKLFRERLLARLIERHAISPGARSKTLELAPSGFLRSHRGAHTVRGQQGQSRTWRPILSRHRLSLKKLVYLDGRKAVLYRSKMNPGPRPELRGPWTLSSGSHAWPTTSRTRASIARARMATMPIVLEAPESRRRTLLEGAPAEVPKKRR